MPYTNDDAYTEGWNDAMKEMKEKLKKDCNEAYRKGLYSNNENVVRHINNNKTLTCDLQTTKKENEKLKRQMDKLKNEATECDDEGNGVQFIPADGVLHQLRNNFRLIGDSVGITGAKRLDSVVTVPEYTREILEEIAQVKKDKKELNERSIDCQEEINRLRCVIDELKEDSDEEEDSDCDVQCDQSEEVVDYINNLEDIEDDEGMDEDAVKCADCEKIVEYEECVHFLRDTYYCIKCGVDENGNVVEDVCKDCYKRDCSCDDEDERMVDWKAGEFCCVDYKFRGKCSVCNEEGRWVAVDKDDDGKDEPVMCCYGCDTGIDDEDGDE